MLTKNGRVFSCRGFSLPPTLPVTSPVSSLHFLMRALAFVLGAALLQSAAAAYVRPPCELNKTRAGFDILSATLPADGNRITIVQCGDTPIERPNFNLLRTSDFRTISYGMQSVYLNAAYAALHGYKYEFYVVDANGTFGRNPSWCRVPAVKRALKVRPNEALLRHRRLCICYVLL